MIKNCDNCKHGNEDECDVCYTGSSDIPSDWEPREFENEKTNTNLIKEEAMKNKVMFMYAQAVKDETIVKTSATIKVLVDNGEDEADAKLQFARENKAICTDMEKLGKLKVVICPFPS
jgi:CRISPR/Cas system-associated protein Cas7 (RAMP superfamily)